MTDMIVIPIDRLDLTFVPKPWEFAEARRAEIDAHFAAAQRSKPMLYNGRVLLMHRHAFEGAALRGQYLETDFASFLAWRDWGCPGSEVKNCFALGALRGSDGGFLTGVMAAHTANAGKVYFPGGTPDPNDRVEGRVDLEMSVRREVAEETGLLPDEVAFEPGWTAVLAGPRIALIKLMQAREPAAALRERILKHLRSEALPELIDMHVVRGPADIHPMMLTFMRPFLEHVWRSESALSRAGGGGVR